MRITSMELWIFPYLTDLLLAVRLDIKTLKAMKPRATVWARTEVTDLTITIGELV